MAAIQCVAQNDRMEGAEKERSIDLLLGLFARGKPVPVRTAAAAALVKMGRGVERVYKVLSAAVDDPSADVRIPVFSILADLGDRRAIGVLKDRRAKEDHRISQDPLDAIDSALKRLESSGDRDQLQNEVNQLRDANERLERRMKALEEKGAAKGERRY